MSRRTTLPLAALGVTLLLGAGLAGCATAAPGGTGAPDDGGQGGTESEIDAAWLDDGRLIGVVTQGSSTCVPIAEEATYADGVLEVTFLEPDADQPCTMDLVPRVTLVGVPEGVDPGQDLEIRVSGDGVEGSTDLDGVAGLAGPGGETDYLPSAGWTDTPGQFVIVTWGSSSCPPVIASVAPTAAAEITVTFEEPPADQVCTMDMAPRGTIAVVDGLEDGDDVELILTGAEFDNIKIPIYGDDD